MVSEPRLGGNAKPDPNLPVPAIPLFLPDLDGFPESRKKTKGEPRRGGDSLFTSRIVIGIPDSRGFKGWTGFYDLHAVSLLLTVGVVAACPSIRNPISNIERCATT